MIRLPKNVWDSLVIYRMRASKRFKPLVRNSAGATSTSSSVLLGHFSPTSCEAPLIWMNYVRWNKPPIRLLPSYCRNRDSLRVIK